MRTGLHIAVSMFVLGIGVSLAADWTQWAHDPQHNGYLPDVQGQSVGAIRWALTIDNTISPSGSILIHYASPLIDQANNIFMTKKERIDTTIHRSVMKLDADGNVGCSYESDYVPPPSAWEPVFHPVLANGILYVPGARGVLHLVSPDDCTEFKGSPIAPYEIPEDELIRLQLLSTVFVAGVPSVDLKGNLYYPMLARFGAPLDLKNQFVKVDPSGGVSSVNYADLTGDSSQRPPLNGGAAIGPDGTIYIGSVGGPGWLLALNPDLTLKWQGSMSADPGRAALLIDQSSSCPVVGPDGRVFYGGWNSNGQSQGYLYSFSPDGVFLGSFDFGWDTTPAVYPDPDGDPAHYHLVQKYNRYAERRYYMVSLDPNTMSIECQWELVGREWCINAPAIDQTGAIYTNGEDGYLYRLTGMYPVNGKCNPDRTRILLDQARDAAYTPLALAPDGAIYTLNNGRLFAVGDPIQ
jgi:hypothetical protein